MLLEQPTSSLDSTLGQQVMEMIQLLWATRSSAPAATSRTATDGVLDEVDGVANDQDRGCDGGLLLGELVVCHHSERDNRAEGQDPREPSRRPARGLRPRLLLPRTTGLEHGGIVA
jgi:hypothetical protein